MDDALAPPDLLDAPFQAVGGAQAAARGLRQRQDGGGITTSTYYLPGGVEEVRSDGSLAKDYIVGGLALGLNTAADASGISYLMSDGLGSVQEALDGSGTVTASQLHSPYGQVRYRSGVMPTTKGFTGQRDDAAVNGLLYYDARSYDPLLGQFTTGDSVADGLNRYGYVAGNPTTRTDPTGHRMDSGDTLGGGDGGGDTSGLIWRDRDGHESYDYRDEVYDCLTQRSGCGGFFYIDVNGYNVYDERDPAFQRHDGADFEYRDAKVLSSYLHLSVVIQPPSRVAPTADYIVGPAVIGPAINRFGAAVYITHPTKIEQYTPTSSNGRTITSEILRKGENGGRHGQAPIVAVDVTVSPYFAGWSDEALEKYAGGLVSSAGPYRVIIIRNDTVVADVGTWGPDAYHPNLV